MPAKKKANMGRPSKGLSEVTAIFRLPAGLNKQVKNGAKKQGISVSEWWRQAAEAKLKA